MVDPRVRFVAVLVTWAMVVLAAAMLLGVGFLPAATATSYVGVSTVTRVVGVGAGVVLAAAAAATWIEQSARRTATLAAVCALAWLAPELEGWESGPDVVRSLSPLAGLFLPAFLLHLVATFGNRPQSRPIRWTVVSVYACIGSLAVARAALRSPLLDPYCWRNCRVNSLLVVSKPWAQHSLDRVSDVAAVTVAALTAFVALDRLRAATPVSRSRLWPVLLPAALVSLTQLAYDLTLFAVAPEDPRRVAYKSIYVGRAGALAALGVGLFAAAARIRRGRSAITKLAQELETAPAPGRLQEALIVATGDPSLVVAYPLDLGASWVDGEGRPVDLAVESKTSARTTIVRGGAPAAVVTHDPALVGGADVAHNIGAAARLAVDNERLRANILARLRDLRVSRQRIITRGDAERRRLERNLHDGAQHDVLALWFELRDAASHAANGNSELLEQAVVEAHLALADLRELARGIYPTVLDQAGLTEAVRSLAESSALPIEIDAPSQQRYPPRIEAAAFIAVRAAVSDAADRGASHALVCLAPQLAALVVTVDHDGSPREGRPMIEITDRIEALGGSVVNGSTRMRVELPCE